MFNINRYHHIDARTYLKGTPVPRTLTICSGLLVSVGRSWCDPHVVALHRGPIRLWSSFLWHRVPCVEATAFYLTHWHG